MVEFGRISSSLTNMIKQCLNRIERNIHISFMCSTALRLRPRVDGLKHAIELKGRLSLFIYEKSTWILVSQKIYL